MSNLFKQKIKLRKKNGKVLKNNEKVEKSEDNSFKCIVVLIEIYEVQKTLPISKKKSKICGKLG